MKLYRTASQQIRRGLSLFLLLLLYDGALRKWVLPEAEQILFIVKDALFALLVVYTLPLRRRLANGAMLPPARTLFMLYAAWVCLEAVNLNLPSPLVGIWGLKAHLFYTGLILLLPLAFQNLDDLFPNLVRIYPWVVIPVCAVAFAQLAAPADSFINQQVRGGVEGISYFGETNLVRVAGTFSYISGMGSFVQVSLLLGFALFLAGNRSLPFFTGLGFAMAALPATGSRGVVITVLSGALIMLFSAMAAQLVRGRLMFRILVVIGILGAVSLHAQDAAWEAFVQRLEGSRYDQNRVISAFTNAFDYFDISGLFGFGSGSANLGAPALVKNILPFSWLPVGTRFEEESGRIVLELGLIGWLISICMRVAFLFWACKLALQGGRPTIRMASVLALPVMALGVHVGNGVFAPPMFASYYWFCVAVLAMAQYEQQQVMLHLARFKAQQLGHAHTR